MDDKKWIMSYIASYLRTGLPADDVLNELAEHKVDMGNIISLMKKHSVISLLEPLVRDDEEDEGRHGFNIPGEYMSLVKKECKRIAVQNYRLLFLAKYIVGILKEDNIKAAVLKGSVVSSYYPVPELRKSGDVDILVPGDDTFVRAVECLCRHGFVKEDNQHAGHHIAMKHTGSDSILNGIEIEIHRELSEPFDGRKVNSFIKNETARMIDNITDADVFGVGLTTLRDGHNAFYLLVHMMHHFIRAGFGIKFLCDWTVFWNRDVSKEDIKCYTNCIRESGLVKFSDMITSVCIRYLGLDEKKAEAILTDKYGEEDCMLFMDEVWESAEFGSEDENRMVMLKGTGFKAYISEFHHQTCINFPRASRVFITWPVLWIYTLVRFIRNNRKVRNTSLRTVLSATSKRSRRISHLKLFEKL